MQCQREIEDVTVTNQFPGGSEYRLVLSYFAVNVQKERIK